MPNTTMESISTEKTRIAGRLAKIDIERTKLVTELAEFEAAERVFEKYSSNPTKAAKAAPKTTAASSEGAQPPRRRGRPAKVTADATSTAATKTPAKRLRKTGGITLGTAVYNVIEKYPSGVTVPMIMTGLKSEYGMPVRANHLGIALKRHRIAGRLQEHEGRWYTPTAFAQAA